MAMVSLINGRLLPLLSNYLSAVMQLLGRFVTSDDSSHTVGLTSLVSLQVYVTSKYILNIKVNLLLAHTNLKE